MHTFKITKTDETGFSLECEVGHYAPDGSWIVNKTADGVPDAINLVRELNGGISENDLFQFWHFLRNAVEFLEAVRRSA